MAFWQVEFEKLQLPEELDGERERVLWFGPDPWEQLQMVELLAYMSEGPCSIVPLQRPVAAMTPAEVADAFKLRRPADSLRFFAAALWFDFCDDDRHGINLRLRRATHDPRLPHLAAAVRRVIQDRSEQRTERTVADLVREGVSDLPALMEALRARELPSHGAWYGDTIVERLRAAALTAT